MVESLNCAHLTFFSPEATDRLLNFWPISDLQSCVKALGLVTRENRSKLCIFSIPQGFSRAEIHPDNWCKTFGETNYRSRHIGTLICLFVIAAAENVFLVFYFYPHILPADGMNRSRTWQLIILQVIHDANPSRFILPSPVDLAQREALGMFIYALASWRDD